jgi:hypothetical protein
MMHLYDPRKRKAASTCPPHPWLFEKRIAGPKTENDALPLPQINWKQTIPSYSAKSLVAYLQSLNLNYALPEAPLK